MECTVAWYGSSICINIWFSLPPSPPARLPHEGTFVRASARNQQLRKLQCSLLFVFPSVFVSVYVFLSLFVPVFFSIFVSVFVSEGTFVCVTVQETNSSVRSSPALQTHTHTIPKRQKCTSIVLPGQQK